MHTVGYDGSQLGRVVFVGAGALVRVAVGNTGDVGRGGDVAVRGIAVFVGSSGIGVHVANGVGRGLPFITSGR